MIDLRLGRYQDVLQDVTCDAVIVDAPYSERTHKGHSAGVETGDSAGYNYRNDLDYGYWTPENVAVFVDEWSPRCRGWMVALTDTDLMVQWRDSFSDCGLTSFAPLPVLMPGMTVRLMGDGPSSWSVYACVARPKSLSKWGTLPGGYYGTPERNGVVGCKPLWLMSAIIRDYSRPGDLICDPCAGGATTLIAAASQGRRAIGAEMDPVTYEKAMRRIKAGYTPDWIEAHA